MEIFRFDEEILSERLKKLSTLKVHLFAVACAIRLMNQVKFINPTSEVAKILAEADSAIWESIEFERSVAVDRLEGELIEVMPDELVDDGFEAAVFEDALASMMYALRSSCVDCVQNAVWAAARAYETVDRFASGVIDSAIFDKNAERDILIHAAVQRELMRQERDINFLEQENSDADIIRRIKNIEKNEIMF